MRRLERSARQVLDRLNEQVGAGLLAAGTVPALAALVDQHAAAVRDILTFGVPSAAAVGASVLLARYAQGLLDHVRERGEQLRVPGDQTGWLAADWVSMRLVAVCSLATTLQPGHRFAPPTDLPSLA